MKKFLRRLFTVLISLVLILFAGTYLLYLIFSAPDPQIANRSIETSSLTIDKGIRRIGNDWMRKNDHGLFEVMVSGSPYDRGYKLGQLTQDLVIKQEDIFVNQIDSLVPSKVWQFFLHKFIGVFNKDLDENIPQEYLQEIYGVSRSASEDYDYVGNKYNRILNYHAAHDIGHALKEMKMVGCTSFAVWDEFSDDSSMVVGRNFDFYVGDKFAEEKEIVFYKPDTGIPFCIISWGGFIGCASGMNTDGITVTINAATSSLPTETATPISIVAREILQYSHSIDEAIEIAKRRKVFVSESILVTSGREKKTVIIEKSPDSLGVYTTDEHKIICSNHNQSDVFKDRPANITNIQETSSMYRWNRVQELLGKYGTLDHTDACEMLRNPYGSKDSLIGFGNEMALNQLLAHHSVIFKPEQNQIWVSTSPFQFGAYLCYDLDDIFSPSFVLSSNTPIYVDSLTIAPSQELQKENWQNFVAYKQLRGVIRKAISEENPLEADLLQEFEERNPNYFDVYEIKGDYYTALDEPSQAKAAYQKALLCAIPTQLERGRIERKMTSLHD